MLKRILCLETKEQELYHKAPMWLNLTGKPYAQTKKENLSITETLISKENHQNSKNERERREGAENTQSNQGTTKLS